MLLPLRLPAFCQASAHVYMLQRRGPGAARGTGVPWLPALLPPGAPAGGFSSPLPGQQRWRTLSVLLWLLNISGPSHVSGAMPMLAVLLYCRTTRTACCAWTASRPAPTGEPPASTPPGPPTCHAMPCSASAMPRLQARPCGFCAVANCWLHAGTLARAASECKGT